MRAKLEEGEVFDKGRIIYDFERRRTWMRDAGIIEVEKRTMGGIQVLVFRMAKGRDG